MAEEKSTANPHADAYKGLRRTLQALDGLITHYYSEHHGNPDKQTERANEMQTAVAAAHKSIASSFAPSVDAENNCPAGTFPCNGDCIPIGEICP